MRTARVMLALLLLLLLPAAALAHNRAEDDYTR